MLVCLLATSVSLAQHPMSDNEQLAKRIFRAYMVGAEQALRATTDQPALKAIFYPGLIAQFVEWTIDEQSDIMHEVTYNKCREWAKELFS